MFVAIWSICMGIICEPVEEKRPKHFEDKGVCIEYAKSRVEEFQNALFQTHRKTFVVLADCRKAVGA